MLRKKIVTVLTVGLASAACIQSANAQDSLEIEKPKPKISGSVDGYYRFNFHNAKKIGAINNLTSFTNSQNSFELGMASIKLEHSFGKVGATIDLGVGKRAQEFSYPDQTISINEDGETVTSANLLTAIKQAFVTYSPSDKVKFTFGKFGTHVGYEVLDPQFNRNYSMSHMFSYGPFSHTGLKMDIATSENTSFMVGIANPNDFATAQFEKKYALAQFHAATSDGGLSGYLNYAGGKDTAKTASHQVDLVVTGKVSNQFSIGYNGTVRSLKPNGEDNGTFWGSALYFNYDPLEKFGLTLRGEYFDDKKNGTGGAIGTSIFSTTLSANFRIGGLTIIPEIRHDAAKDAIYFKNNANPVKNSTSALVAAVYSF